MAARGSKPGERRGGRKPGTPNKISTDIKGMIEAALHTVGGKRYLTSVARKHPEVFCRLLARLIPKDLNLNLTPPRENDPVDDIALARHLYFLLNRGVRAGEKMAAEAKANGEPPRVGHR